jgi:multisubunit Na+/H+ antiporter MnhG subunit
MKAIDKICVIGGLLSLCGFLFIVWGLDNFRTTPIVLGLCLIAGVLIYVIKRGIYIAERYLMDDLEETDEVIK